MTEDRKNIDRLFKESLGGYRAKAPVNAWQRLDEELNRKDRNKSLMFFRLAAAAVIILMAFGAGYFYAVNFTNQDAITNNTKNTEPAIEMNNQMPVGSVAMDDDLGSNLSTDNDITEQAGLSSDLKSGNTAEASLASIQTMDEPSIDLMKNQKQGSVESSLADNIADDASIHRLKSRYPETFLEPAISKFKEQAEAQHTFAKVAVFREIPVDYTPDQVEQEFVYGGLPENAQTLKWTIGAQVAPTVSFRDISTNYSGDPSQNIDERNHLNQTEVALHSYSGGVQVALAMNDKWGFQSGMYFSRIGQVSNDALQFKQDSKGFILYGVNTSAGAVNVRFEKVPSTIRSVDSPKDTLPPGNIQNVKIVQNFDLFEIPFLVNYNLLNKKFSIKLAGGLSPAYLVDNKTTMELDNSNYEIGDASNLNNLIINSSLGLGIGYEFVKKFTISFEPTFKYSLNPINKGSDFDYHPYYFSWFTGIKYTF